MTQAVEEKIRDFIGSNFLVEFGVDFRGDTDLFKAGVVDSFGYLQLITFLQDEFSVVYSDEEMLTNIMVSLDAIVNSVQLKVSVS